MLHSLNQMINSNETHNTMTQKADLMEPTRIQFDYGQIIGSGGGANCQNHN